MTAPIVSANAAAKRLVRRSDLVPCKMAFIDCKIPGSELKENYSIIGAGVSESTDQFVNIQEPHGFSLGVAAMPPGVTNNLHIHYTAEVFMVLRGEWLFRWGAEGKDGEIIGRTGDVVSIPTWIFRGFTNVGQDDGWIFTCLGRDDCGGLIWHPSILRGAQKHGLYLTRDDVVVDTSSGTSKPREEDLVEPLSDSVIAGLDRYTLEDMLQRVVTTRDRVWSERAFLDSVLPGHRTALAPVVGNGMTEDRRARPKINNPHGFAIEWLRIEAGQVLGAFRIEPKQVLIVYQGQVEIQLNQGEHAVHIRMETQETYSMPSAVWRSLRATSEEPAILAVLTAGDARARIEWDEKIVAAAQNSGFAIDPDGYLAPTALLPYTSTDPGRLHVAATGR